MPNVLSEHFRMGSALSGLSCQVSAYHLPQSCKLGGISMHIQRKYSAHHFRMQSEREQSLVLVLPFHRESWWHSLACNLTMAKQY